MSLVVVMPNSGECYNEDFTVPLFGMCIPGGRASGGWGAGAIFRSVLVINFPLHRSCMGGRRRGGRVIGQDSVGTPCSQPGSRLRDWLHPVHVSSAS